MFIKIVCPVGVIYLTLLTIGHVHCGSCCILGMHVTADGRFNGTVVIDVITSVYKRRQDKPCMQANALPYYATWLTADTRCWSNKVLYSRCAGIVF